MFLARRRFAPILGLWLALAATPAAADLHFVNPTLDARNARYVEKAMARAREEVEAVVRAASTKSAPLRLESSAAYGSWFVPFVRVGADLDYMGIIDLGEVGPGPQGADAAIARIEAFLKAFETRRSKQPDPTMAFLKSEGLDEHGRLVDRARAAQIVTEALTATLEDRGMIAKFDHNGQEIPYAFPAGQVSITVHPRAKYLSNQFETDDTVLSHVRELSLQFFFTLRVRAKLADPPKTLLLQPLYKRAGSPILLRRFIFETVFDRVEARDAFAAIAQRGFDLATRRPQYGAFILHVGRMEVRNGRALKAAKRVLQSYLVLADGLSPELKAAFEKGYGAWMSSPGVTVLADLVSVADIFESAAKKGAEAAFRNSGDLERLIERYRAALALIRRAHPEHADALGRLANELDAIERAAPDQRVAAWQAVIESAGGLAKVLGPPLEGVSELATRLTSTLRAAGVFMVPVAGIQGDHMYVSEPWLAELGLAAKHVDGRPAEHLTFAVVSPDEIARRFGADAPTKPLRNVYARLDTGSESAAAWRTISEGLDRTNAGFHLGR